ncbi:MAG: hypothetical protein V7744_20850 [Pseudomonadales bacterium]
MNRWITYLTNLVAIVGVAILIYEVSQNTQALKNETDVAVYQMGIDNRQKLIENNQLRELYYRVETIRWSELTKDEQYLLLAYWTAELDRTELQYILHRRNGTKLDNIVFNERDLLLEPFQTGWSAWKVNYDADFVEFFDGIISRAKLNDE